MALPPAFLDELRARTPLPALIGRRTRLERAGRQLKACCPFHGEKTASFYIYEDHYHCFGCGAHGDAISFVMQSEGAGFMEAVERLAGEAGLEVPKLSPAVAQAEQHRHTISGALEAAASAFQRRLLLPEGAAARAYLADRGLTEATIRRFGLGWSGAGGAVIGELTRAGIPPEVLTEAGLLRPDTESGPGGAFFFNRVMFPIRDRRGAVISFGGRVLGDGKPKYLNGPETPVFAKRRGLYGLDLARAALRERAPRPPELVVVEGYMDVIGLAQSGFGAAVAPLGTALTEDQLGELWRLSPAPILCFDGDAAGARAAARAALLALPLLAPDRTLRLAQLPNGEDPDSLVRARGPAGFQAVLDAARPLSDALYDLIREQVGEKTPEQRAALRHRLEEAAGRIPDPALAREYRGVLLDRFHAARASRRSGGRPLPPRPPPRAAPSEALAATERARILLAILLRQPGLYADVGPALAGLDLPAPMARLHQALAEWTETAVHLDSGALMNHLTATGLSSEAARILATPALPLPAFASESAMPGEAEAGWWHFFSFMHRDRLDAEVAAAQRDFAACPDAATQRRLIALSAAREALRRGEESETAP